MKRKKKSKNEKFTRKRNLKTKITEEIFKVARDFSAKNVNGIVPLIPLITRSCHLCRNLT